MNRRELIKSAVCAAAASSFALSAIAKAPVQETLLAGARSSAGVAVGDRLTMFGTNFIVTAVDHPRDHWVRFTAEPVQPDPDEINCPLFAGYWI